MATSVAPAKQSSRSKHDVQIVSQIERAQRRIRALDVTTALLTLLAGTLAYAVVVGLLDHKLELDVLALRLALVLYLLAAGAFTAFFVLRPLTWRINPYYAARKVEQTVDGAKNSLINWLDLHEEQLPPAIRASLTQRAVRDLAQADLERAVSARRTRIVGAAAGVLLIVLLALLWLLPAGTFARVFGLSSEPRLPSTRITLIEPAEGNTTVADGKAFNLRVEIKDLPRSPDETERPRLLTRHDGDTVWQERLLDRETSANDEWSALVPATDVKTGFWYRVSAGDAATPEYRVDYRAAPLIDSSRFLVTYSYRDYLHRKADRVQRRERKIEDFKGTRVTVEVPTNRKLAEAWLMRKSADERWHRVPGTIDPKDGQRFTASWVLRDEADKGKYKVHFVTADGEPFNEVGEHDLIARADRAPQAELRLPGQDIELPVSGQLELEGTAWDDVGVRSVTLKMKVEGGVSLADRSYRSDKELRLADGGYPLVLDYKDVVPLPGLQDVRGKAIELKPGMVLEYWLEATDECDLPAPNVGESKRFKVRLIAVEPQDQQQHDQQQAQDRQRAKQELEQHKKEQDEKLKKENEARQKDEQKRKDEADRNRQEGTDKKEPDKGGTDKKEPDKGGTDKKNPPDKSPPEKKPGNEGNEPNRTEPDKQKDEQTRKQADKLKEALDKEKKEQEKKNEPGQGKKDDKQDPGQGKQDPGQGKQEGGKPEAGKEQGQGKASGDKKEPQPSPGKNGAQNQPQPGKTEGKDKGEPMNGGGQQGADKGDAQKQPMSEQPGQGKPQNGKDEKAAAPERGEGKQQGEPMSGMEQGQQGQDKKEGTEPGADQKQGQGKDGAPEQGMNNTEAGQAKGQPQPKKDERGSGKNDGDKQTARGEPKKGGPMEKGAPEAAQDKDKGNGQNQPKEGDKSAQGKPAGQQPRPAEADNKPGQNATREQVEQVARDLKSDDPAKREEARRKLEQAAENAQSPEARQQAEKELEKQGRGEKERQPATSKTPPPPPTQDPMNQAGQPCEKCKDGPGQGNMGAAQAGAGKDGPGNQAPGQGEEGKAKGQPKKSPDPGMGQGAGQNMGDPMTNPNKPGQGEGEPGRGQGQAKNKWGDKPATGPVQGDGGRPSETADPTVTPTTPDKADPRHRQHAGDLQLKGLDDAKKRKVLKDAGFKNEQEYNEFMKAYREMVDREANEPKTTEPTVPGQALQTTGPRQVKKGDGTTDADTRSLAKPPVEYRDSYDEFTRKLAEKLRNRDKK